MQPIRIYNRFLDLKAEVDTYQSLQFGRNYHGVADFELHINRYMHKADEIFKGDIIALGTQSNKAGIILSKEIALDQSGKESENFKLTGYTLDGLIKRRITVPPSDTAYDRKSGDAETVMKHYIERHFVNPDDVMRRMPYIEVATNQHRGAHVEWESRFKNVADELENISIQSGLGWGVFADFKNKRLTFDVIERRDLTQDNPYGNNPVFFSPEFETIKNQDFVDSDNDLKTVGYVGGQGEGTDRKVVTIGDNTGWDRIETFVDARDVGNNDEEELTDEEIEKKLRERGQEKMRDMETIFTLEAEILTPVTRTAYEYTHEGYLQPAQPTGRYERKQQQITPFAYEKDFDLGDMVQVVNKSWGLTMTAPITAFKEIHEPGGFRLEATFGRDRPTLISKIQDKFDELEGIEKQELPAQVAVETRNYIDEGLTQEEQERIEQAKQNLAEAKGFTRDYAEKKVIKSNTAPSDTDVLWFDTSKTPNIIKAHDGTEWRKATPTEAGELVYSDGTPVENLKPNEAGSDVTGNNTANDTLNVGGRPSSDIEDKQGSQEKADNAERNAKDYSEDASNIMRGIMDVGSVPIKTAPNGARIEFDGQNGFVQYDANDNPVSWLDLHGDARFKGRVEANEGYFGDNLKLRNGKIEIVRPDGAVSMSDGMVRDSFSVSGNDPNYMTAGRNADSGTTFVSFSPGGLVEKNQLHVYGGVKGMLDGRGVGDAGRYEDVRDDLGALAFQKYDFVHASRYLVFGFNKYAGSTFSVHVVKGDSASVDDRLYYEKLEKDVSGVNHFVVDLGVPDYSTRTVTFKIGWTHGWGDKMENIRFIMENVYLTDFIEGV